MSKEISNQEILNTISALSQKVDQKFGQIDEKSDQKFEKLDKKIDHTANNMLEAISAFSDETDKRFASIEKDVISTRATMVTKDYLDEKLSDLRGDLVVLTRKEDTKGKKLISILQKRKLLNEKEVKEILSMEPFPQLSI